VSSVPAWVKSWNAGFFGGLTEEKIAEALGVTTRTVKRDWAKARGWLYQELTE